MSNSNIKPTLLSPARGKCPDCAVAHDPAHPHDAMSLYWQTKQHLNDQPYDWPAAMSHCTKEVKAAWTTLLKEQYGYGCPNCDGWKLDRSDYICATCRESLT